MPSTPASFVTFAANAASVMTGSRSSSPTSDHVPALTKAEPSSRNGTAATAEPVSCVATATTSARPRPLSSATPSERGASTVPGSTTSGKTRAGTPSRSRRSSAHARRCGSKHCVVLAFVRSEVCAPQSRKWKRSGIISSRSAAASASSPSAASAPSSKMVLIGINWMPVRSYSSRADTRSSTLSIACARRPSR